MDTRRALLDALSEGPVSGPALAEELGVSRAAVWKAVEALREEGFTSSRPPTATSRRRRRATPRPASNSDSTRRTRSSITTASRRRTNAVESVRLRVQNTS